MLLSPDFLVVCSVGPTGSSTMCSHHSARAIKQRAAQGAQSTPSVKGRGGEVDLSVLPSTSSHHGDACCCKLTPRSTYQSRLRWFVWEETNGPFLRCFFFNTAVPLQCRVLETGGECTGLVMRLDFLRPPSTPVCVLADVMVKTCVCLLTQQMASAASEKVTPARFL